MSSLSPTEGAEAAPAPVRLSDLFALRAYKHFWFVRLAGQFGSQMAMVALGWQMYELTRSAWDLGLVGLLQFLPALLLTLPAGQLADRHHRGRIVLATGVLQLGASALLLLATWDGWMGRTLILALSAVFGIARAFQLPAMQSLTPLLVPARLLPRALAFNAGGMQVGIIGGPALAGLLFAFGLVWVYAVATLAFVVAAALMTRVRYDAPPRPAGAAGWSTLFDGIHFLRRQPVLLGAMSLDLFAVLLGGATALLPMFVVEILHAPAWALGLLRAAPAVGAVLMSVWLARHPLERQVGRVLIGAVGVYGLCMLVFGLSSWLWLSFAALLVSGAADMVSVVIRQTLVQLETPDEMRGRVNAVNAVFIGASNQLGEFESGATAAWLGPVGSVVLGGVGVLLIAAAWVRVFPTLWARDHLHRMN